VESLFLWYCNYLLFVGRTRRIRTADLYHVKVAL
jgi:hypothetical protein